MTKRQHTMIAMLVRVSFPKESVLEFEHIAISPSTSIINNNKKNHIKMTNE